MSRLCDSQRGTGAANARGAQAKRPNCVVGNTAIRAGGARATTAFHVVNVSIENALSFTTIAFRSHYLTREATPEAHVSRGEKNIRIAVECIFAVSFLLLGVMICTMFSHDCLSILLLFCCSLFNSVVDAGIWVDSRDEWHPRGPCAYISSLGVDANKSTIDFAHP